MFSTSNKLHSMKYQQTLEVQNTFLQKVIKTHVNIQKVKMWNVLLFIQQTSLQTSNKLLSLNIELKLRMIGVNACYGLSI